MLDFVHMYRRLTFLVLLILAFPSFVFFGMQSCPSFIDNSYDATRTDGKVISINEVDARVCEQTERPRQMLGAQCDPRQSGGPQIRRDVLDGIIQQRVLANETMHADLTISNEKIYDTILQIPAMVALRKPDGSFDQETYVRLLSAQNMTPEQLEDSLRFEPLQRQIP